MSLFVDNLFPCETATDLTDHHIFKLKCLALFMDSFI